jgi:hypothetical protein
VWAHRVSDRMKKKEEEKKKLFFIFELKSINKVDPG